MDRGVAQVDRGHLLQGPPMLTVAHLHHSSLSNADP